jgi:hypothetical protein
MTVATNGNGNGTINANDSQTTEVKQLEMITTATDDNAIASTETEANTSQQANKPSQVNTDFGVFEIVYYSPKRWHWYHTDRPNSIQIATSKKGCQQAIKKAVQTMKDMLAKQAIIDTPETSTASDRSDDGLTALHENKFILDSKLGTVVIEKVGDQTWIWYLQVKGIKSAKIELSKDSCIKAIEAFTSQTTQASVSSADKSALAYAKTTIRKVTNDELFNLPGDRLIMDATAKGSRIYAIGTTTQYENVTTIKGDLYFMVSSNKTAYLGSITDETVNIDPGAYEYLNTMKVLPESMKALQAKIQNAWCKKTVISRFLASQKAKESKDMELQQARMQAIQDW